MKIEKISDNQIRCTLTSEDLEQRRLKLSELAYGSEKAKQLFHDMMQQAAFQCGFEAENTPLMIEAIPLDPDSIVLIVTKVENPEELDTRFSSFGPSIQNSAARTDPDTPVSPFEQLMNAVRSGVSSKNDGERSGSSENADRRQTGPSKEEIARMKRFLLLNRLFCFDSLGSTINAAVRAGSGFVGESSLYYDSGDGKYYLFLTMADLEAVQKQQGLLSTLSEYGQPQMVTYARQQHLMEHCSVICAENALGELSKI